MKQYRVHSLQENKYSLEVKRDTGGGGYQWKSCEYLCEEEVDILAGFIDEHKNKRRAEIKRLKSRISHKIASIALLQVQANTNKNTRESLTTEVGRLQLELTRLEE